MNISELHKLFLTSSGINTDTRTIKENELFFSLSGDNFNGNKFAQQAIDKGAKYAVIDDKDYETENTILVSNTLETLQDLARYHRNQLSCPIIALTGSNGKTTTKELINAVLKTSYKTSATIGNLNNHIGVPLTLLRMHKDTEIGIVEMGANHLKEIEFLCNIAQPDYGYITNFGKAHLEGFGSLEGVIKGKSELYAYLKNKNKSAFIDLDNNKQVTQASNINHITFSQTKKSYINCKFIDANPNVRVAFDDSVIHSNLIGSYNFTNISAAICIGKYFKVSDNNIKNAIENYIPTNNRSQIVEKNSNKIILDAYNANPTSMRAALENFNRLEAKHKTVFIGDMFELGADSEKEHQDIVNYIKTLKIDSVYILGKQFNKTTHSNIQAFVDFNDFKEQFKTKISNSTILIKGSRGMALERIIDIL
ncbi:UDP-N-acetylmuramoyl-tripeptide--D-alanyl-D-alanine ligase [Pseudofulvibacter geojedonensis]|uniref:UDP-N-acetylmuramoyl-tripeptide--D-alanyl-D-alanine ligase n=1 Tax=Pseudofulvibacter geojedonensis TaxID=1123758 RepID=A0ABW3I5E2_9FLAO